MKNNKTTTLYYITSVLFYIAAILNLTNLSTGSVIINIALGSTFLCLGAANSKDNKDNKKDED